MIKAFQFLVLGAAFTVQFAHADETLPKSCRPEIVGAALGNQAESAQLQCDIDRAALLGARSETLFSTYPDTVVRIVDTDSPSGAAYIYDVINVDGTMMLDARSVPSDMDDERHVPVCRLQRQLPGPVANDVAISLLTATKPDVPSYGPRERMVINDDGSRTYELLLDTHDIITSIKTADGLRQFSRHAQATDEIARLNTGIIGVANFSDGWVCNTD